MVQGRSVRRTVALVAALVAALLAPAVGRSVAVAAPDALAAGAPATTPARAGQPSTVAVFGDSISQSTGTGPLSQENPENSWATGWSINSVAAQLGIPTNQRYNFATNGHRMTHFAGQVTNGKSGGSGSVSPMPTTTGLVLLEMGGNDLCRSSVADMTSVTDYRNQFVAGLNAVRNRAPDALIQVMSIPDIYNLWYIRGAPQDPTYHPEGESSQASGINGARFYWDGLTDLGVKFPCQSLLANPNSWAEPDIARREQVRQRTKDYNAVLAQECAKVIQCRFDGNQLFDWSSNRISPPDGQLLPLAARNLTDNDISRNTQSLCPLSGLSSDGCGDHFHPSAQGQQKIANVAVTYGYDFDDTTFPTAGAQVLPTTRPDDLHHGRATVRFSGGDDVALRGQEVRVHRPNGSVTGWVPHLGVAADLVIDEVGTSWVEVRSYDVNGNRSASTVTQVDVVEPLLPTAPGAPAVAADASGLQVSWTAPSDDGGGTISRYDLTPVTGTPPTAGATTPVGGLSTAIGDAPAGELLRFQVRAVNATGTGPSSATSAATIAPFGSLAAFVDRQYRDFEGRAPTTGELFVGVDQLASGALSPADFVDQRRSSTWFDGAYGPAIRLYRAYFLRLPDPSGMEYWAARRREGRTLDKMSQQFSVSSEFRNRYGPLTDAEFIDQIYNNVFFRDPDPSGRAFYLRRLANGWSRGQVVLQFSESSEYKRQMTPIVDVVELGRGLNGRVPDQIETEYRLLDHSTGGAAAVFAHWVGTASYRTRVFS